METGARGANGRCPPPQACIFPAVTKLRLIDTGQADLGWFSVVGHQGCYPHAPRFLPSAVKWSRKGENRGLGSRLTLRVPHKAERRVLEEELTVHLSVPGDTILINNRPGPREPPPYQEPRPRGNPPHSAPCVPNSSGKPCLAPSSPSPLLFASLPFFICFNSCPYFRVPGHPLYHSTSLLLTSRISHLSPVVPRGLILSLVSRVYLSTF